MVALFYFSDVDLMIKVEYAKTANALRYASHREMGLNERVIAEQYIMAKVAPKTDYYFKHHSSFVYLGTEAWLKKKLAVFHQENELKSSLRKKREMTASVNDLINVSMRNYYTEKIGELILSARRELKDGRQHEPKLANLKQQMNDLLNAYNVYTDRKVTLNNIIPLELKPYMIKNE